MRFNRKIETKIEEFLQEDCSYFTCVLCGKKTVSFYKIRDEIEGEIREEIGEETEGENSKKYIRVFYAGYCSEHDKEYDEKVKESILKKLILDAPAYFVSEDDL